MRGQATPRACPPEQAPDPTNLQAVAEQLVNDRVSLPLRLAGPLQ